MVDVVVGIVSDNLGLYFFGTSSIVLNLLSVPFPELLMQGLAALKKAECFALAAK